MTDENRRKGDAAKLEGAKLGVWSKEAAKLWHLCTSEELEILNAGIKDFDNAKR
jgi:hypothetical protein